MIIQIKGNFLDFESPIYMRESQRKKFVDGMKSIFGNKVETENIIENRKEISKTDRHPKRFSEEDGVVLANPSLSNEEIANKMGKTSFAIQMKRGDFLMEIQEWSVEKGKSRIRRGHYEEDIRKFLKEKGIR